MQPELETARQKLQKDKKRFPTGRYAQLLFTEEDLRFATSEQVADYRAKKLACNNLLEIGAGVGFQTLAFAKTCKRVLAIEIDKRKADFLKKNLSLMGVRNVDVFVGDCLSPVVLVEIKKKMPMPDFIFLDTQRPDKEEKRSFETIKPPVLTFIDVYSQFSKHIAIELPPRMQEIPFSGEQEYLSLRGHIERFTFYPNKPKKTTLTDLVSGDKIEKGEGTLAIPTSQKPLAFVYKLSDAIRELHLVDQACKPPLQLLDEQAGILTSSTYTTSPFFEGYTFLSQATDEEALLQLLKKTEAAKVAIRFSLPPEEAGRKMKYYTKQLKKGDQTVVIMRLSSGFFIVGSQRSMTH